MVGKEIISKKFRFDSQNNCRSICIDEAYFFFFKEYASKRSVSNLKGTYDILDFFSKAQLEVKISIPLYFLFSPIFLNLTLKRYAHICLSTKSFNNFLDKEDPKAIIYLVTAFQIYKIPESWTHYICEVFEGRKRSYVDSYLSELNTIENKYEPLSHENLKNKDCIKILIFRAK